MPVRLDQEKEGINTEKQFIGFVSSTTEQRRYTFMLSRVKGVNINGVWIGEWNFDTHHSELQVIPALSLISTLYKSLHTNTNILLLDNIHRPIFI
jgi:hypothetical protein